MEPTSQRGRPRMDLDIDAELLRGLAAVGLDLEATAEVLGCSRRTLCDRLVQSPEIRNAYRSGSTEFRSNTVAAARARIALCRAARKASTSG
jgi:hypothetical protein